jgi:hypothetical protein
VSKGYRVPKCGSVTPRPHAPEQIQASIQQAPCVCGITNGDPSTTRSICSCLELAPPPVGDILTCTSKLAVNHNSQSQPHALRLPALGALKGAGRDTVAGSRTPLAFFFLHRGTANRGRHPVRVPRAPNPGYSRTCATGRSGPTTHRCCCCAPWQRGEQGRR